MAALKGPDRLPTVLVVGEIYVRCDPFANDFVIDRLESSGIRVRFAPFTEWLEYVDHVNAHSGQPRGFADWFSTQLRAQIQNSTYQIVARQLAWPPRTSVPDSLRAAAPYIRQELNGEAVLTLGGPLHEYGEGLIDGVLNVGPLECMPSKIAEAQFFHAAEDHRLLSLTLAVNGDPIDPELLDGFIFAVKERFFRQRVGKTIRAPEPQLDKPRDRERPEPLHPRA